MEKVHYIIIFSCGDNNQKSVESMFHSIDVILT